MSLGFGIVTPEDYEGHKAGGGAAQVPPSDYIGRLVKVNHQEPSGENGQGAHWVEFLLTDANANNDVHAKIVAKRFGYHPSPPNKKIETMNGITLDAMAQLIDAAGVEPHATPDGAVDMIATLNALAEMEPTLKFTVTHSTVAGRTYQDLSQFTAVS